jgi:hypothetical protein
MAKIRIKGDTSGYVDLQAPAVAGAGSITVPNLSGTLLTSASDSSDFPTGGIGASNLTSTLDLSSKTMSLPSDKAPMEIISSSDTYTTGISTFDFDLPTDSTYRQFKLILTGMYGTVGADYYSKVRLDGNSGYEEGASDYKYVVSETNNTGGTGRASSTASAFMRLNWYGLGDADGEAVDWEIDIYNSNNSTHYFRLHSRYGGCISNSNPVVGQSTGQYNFGSLVDGLRIYPSTGTMSYRSYTLYGVKRS